MTTLDYADFKHKVRCAGLDCEEFAELVKLNPRSLSNYSRAERIPDHWAIVATLISEMAHSKLEFRSAIEALDIHAKRPRGKSIEETRASRANPAKENE